MNSIFALGLTLCVLFLNGTGAVKTNNTDGDAYDEDTNIPIQPTVSPTSVPPINTTTPSPTTPTSTSTSSTTPAPPTTKPTSTTSSPPPTPPTTSTTSSTTPSSTTSSTTQKPTSTSSTTLSPNITTSTTTTTVKPSTPVPPNSTTHAPPTSTSAPPTDRHFDGPSFIGGIVLALGMMCIGLVAWKFYKSRTERNYHTLSNLGDSSVI